MPRTGLTPSEIKSKAIEITMARMREDGFDKVRLTEIAKDLGVSHASLYAHFEDKAALLDAVSERWLLEIDASLEAVCRKAKEPGERLTLWFLTLHRAKIAKVLHDPELYKAFNLSTAVEKPFVRRHMSTMHTQLKGLIDEAIAKRNLRGADADAMAKLLFEATMSFHHPRLVAQALTEKREPLLRQILETMLKGLSLTR